MIKLQSFIAFKNAISRNWSNRQHGRQHNSITLIYKE